MKKNYCLKKALLSKKAMITWMLIFCEVLFLIIIQEYEVENDLSVYLGLRGLFFSGVLFAQYLLLICYFVNYLKDSYMIIRYGRIENILKTTIKAVMCISLLFTSLLNISTIIAIKIRFHQINILKDLNYILFIQLIQTLSFFIFGYLFIIIFIQRCKIRTAYFVTLLIYMILNLIFPGMELYFLPPITITTAEKINIVTSLVSVNIFILIYLVNRRNRGIELYENKE
jgi:hypothetical protein